jgi:hypothetical protein
VAEEGEGELLGADARDPDLGGVNDGTDGGFAAVGQFAPLEAGPHSFDRIEFGSVAGKAFDLEPSASEFRGTRSWCGFDAR